MLCTATYFSIVSSGRGGSGLVAQDDASTAAVLATTLQRLLGGAPRRFRELQGAESAPFRQARTCTLSRAQRQHPGAQLVTATHDGDSLHTPGAPLPALRRA